MNKFNIFKKDCMNNRKDLWSMDFKRIIVATVLSIVGGEAMNLPISLLVFDKTNSTLASAVIMVCGMLPDIFISVAIAPVIDRQSKKKWIVFLDTMLAIVYFIMGIYTFNCSFAYGVYVVFTLAVATISAIYRLAYEAWYPEIIPKGARQQGYAISATLYPTITIVMAPISTILYQYLDIYIIFFGVALLVVFSIIIESGISVDLDNYCNEYTLAKYFEDIKTGFNFMKTEAGIRNIYSYMSICNGTSEGVGILTQAYYQTYSGFTVMMLGFLKSAEMIARSVGGIFWYKIQIPRKKRYAFTKLSYTYYSLADMFLLWMPYPFMLINRFLCGFVGCGSAVIRETAVKNYLPADIRARVNAILGVMISAGSIFFQIAAALVSKVFGYKISTVIMAAITLICMWIMIIRPGDVNRCVYEA